MAVELSSMGNLETAKLCFRRDKLYTVTDSAARFRDITPDELRKETHLKAGLIFAALIMAVITAVCIYYSLQATDTRTIRWANGQVFDQTFSIAPIATIPAVFGTAIIVWLVAAAAWGANLERNSRWGEKLSEPGAMERELAILTQKDLMTVYWQYYSQNGGVQRLVRGGLINETQGRELNQLFNRSHNLLTSKGIFERRGIPDLSTNSETYPEYEAILKDLEGVETEWRTLQNSIRRQYTVSN